MHIAITGDVHLREKEASPERYKALEDIYSQCRNKGIKHLVIAGDLFDAESQNYSDFDDLLRQYKDIHTYAIPGNHDSGIKQDLFAADNLTVFVQSAIKTIDGRNILFLPYTADKSMGEAIAGKKDEVEGPWILVGHGDYLGGRRETNPYEPGTYMPLNRNDIDHYKPDKVILGHIHKYYETGKLYYTGSPCGMDINETGKRRFLVLDTETGQISSYPVNTEHIYFNETIMALPISNEWEYIKNQIREITQSWNLEPEEKHKAVVRIRLKGYTSSRKKLKELIVQEFAGYRFYKDEGPDLSEVYVTEDSELTGFIEQVKETIYNMDWDSDSTQTRKDDILEEALKLILN